MFLHQFKQPSTIKINKLNNLLKEQFGISIPAGFPKKAKLESLRENANKALVTLRGTSKKFHLEPEYAKFLGIKDIVETMINEGMYAESPAYHAMKEMIEGTVRQLMDSGYTMEEATSECMNRYRMDNRFAYDDEHVMPIVLTAAKNYMDECSMSEKVDTSGQGAPKFPSTDINDVIIRELAKECGVELKTPGSMEAIEEKLAQFAKVTGKSRDAVVGFLNGLDEATMGNGIKMFGRKIAEQNAFNTARDQAIAGGKKKFSFNGKEYDLTSVGQDDIARAMSRFGKKKNESMFSDIVDDILNEEVDVEQAEVVMAVRALADDIQDQVERLGRMINEDVPAIADKMRTDQGAQAAQTFVDSITQVLNAHLESAKTAKAGIDNSVAGLSGEQVSTGLGDTGTGLAAPAATPDMPEEEPTVDANVPAAAGPEKEPLGRAAV
jgi:hypothetical protein